MLYIDLSEVLKIEHFQQSFFFIYIFLIFAQNIDCGYALEPPRGGGSIKYPHMFWIKNKKIRYTPANPSFTISIQFNSLFRLPNTF